MHQVSSVRPGVSWKFHNLIVEATIEREDRLDEILVGMDKTLRSEKVRFGIIVFENCYVKVNINNDRKGWILINIFL